MTFHWSTQCGRYIRNLRKRNQDSRYETNETKRNERNETKHKNFWDSWNEQSEQIGDPGPLKMKIGDPGPPKTKKLAIRTAPKKTINDPGPQKICFKAFLKQSNTKKRSRSQMIDQVMTIKTSTESSKTELSSRGKRPFKVFRFSHFWIRN